MRSTPLPSNTFSQREASSKPQRKSKLPSGASELIARHTITVDNPDDILPYVHSKRERQFQALVQRYTIQLLYGCQNPYCTTPTCFSFQRRNVKTPLRKFTPLSARALACSLASERDPEAALCHNAAARRSEPVTPYTNSNSIRRRRVQNTSPPVERRDDSEPKTRARKSRSDADNKSRGLSVTWKEASEEALPSNGSVDQALNDSIFAQATPNKSLDIVGRVESKERLTREQDAPRKDYRSFTQSLFDTLALRLLTWLPSTQPASDSSLQDPQRTSELEGGSHHAIISSKRLLESSGEDVPHVGLVASSEKPGKHQEQNDRSSGAGSGEPSEGYEALDASGRTVQTSVPRNLLQNSASTSTDNEQESRSSRQGTRRRQSQPARSSFTSKIAEGQAEHHPVMQKSHDLPLGPVSQAARSATSISSVTKSAGDTATDAITNLDRLIVKSDQEPYQTRHSKTRDKVETLSRFSHGILAQLHALVKENELLESFGDQSRSTETSEEIEARLADLSSFIQQSVYFVLKEPARLRRSFHYNDPGLVINEGSDNSGLRSIRKTNTTYEIFQCSYRMQQICSAERIWDSLWIALGQLFVPPPELARSLRHGKKHGRQYKPNDSAHFENRARSQSPSTRQKFVPDIEAARICVITLLALTAKTLDFPHCDESEKASMFFRWSRDIGWCSLPKHLKVTEGDRDAYYKLMDTLDNTSGLRLIGRLTTAISNRVAFSAIRNSRPKDPLMAGLRGTFKNSSVLRTIWTDISSLPLQGFGSKYSVALAILAWATTLITGEWDGKVQVRRSSVMGGSLQMLASMYEARVDLGLEATDFYIRLFSERLDPMDMPAEWLGFNPDNKLFHLLSFPFLFLPSALVQYFRAINHASMWKAFENATAKSHLVRQLLREDVVPIHDERQLLLRLRPSMATFLVLNVRRDNVLTDAINLLWRRERRELLRPLKVQMGMELGEVGIDAGGVQQEFFRILFAEALNPNFGMFTVDERTRMTWYQPASQEPLYKFEMLGLLMSLAVYNSITLSVTFPLAFYRKLLSLKVKKVEHIQDGWPFLAKGLHELLNWSDGDVANVFVRTYEFSYEAYGSRVDVDMERVGREAPWPRGKRFKGKEKAKSASFDFSSEIRGALKEDSTLGNRRPSAPLLTPPDTEGESTSNLHLTPTHPGISTPASQVTVEPDAASNEASLVTNANREQFVKDYIFWLTDKSIRKQHEAFLRGFLVCLDRKAISIFTPEALKAVVEGREKIDIDGLERVARYSDGFSQDDRVIRWFWEVVRDMSPEQHRQLLEFVTASDRLPVQGVEGLVFVVQRSGEDDGRMPTSSTCFGRLLLPAYSSKEILRDRLVWAIQDTQGFFML